MAHTAHKSHRQHNVNILALSSDSFGHLFTHCPIEQAKPEMVFLVIGDDKNDIKSRR